MKIFLPIALFLALIFTSTACQETPKSTIPTPETKTTLAVKETKINGLYQTDGKRHVLRDCDSGKTFWVENTKILDSLRLENLLEPTYEMEPVFVKLDGTLSEIATGAAANYDGLFAIKNIETVETLNFMNCCESYDFWCGGTEPFWNCQIFPEGGFIIFREASGERAFIFPGVKPVISGKSTTYVSKNEAGESVKITIKEEKANDGMSDMVYNFSCKIEVAGRKFSGTALKYGEKIEEK